MELNGLTRYNLPNEQQFQNISKYRSLLIFQAVSFQSAGKIFF